MNRISDRQRVIEVYRLALAYPNWNTTPDKRWTISVGRPDDGGRQISDPCGTSAKAWRSAWEKIVMNAPKTEAGRAD
jgi:hypothetical protein